MRVPIVVPILFLAVMLAPLPAFASPPEREIDRVLAGTAPPAGVVFEVNEQRRDALGSLLPVVNGYIAQLRDRWPDLQIAVVTDGLEVLGLTAKAAGGLPKIESLVRGLKNEHVPVQVCEIAAGMNGAGAEDFPDYVDVVPYGPAQIEDYVKRGYVRIRVRAEDAR